MSPEDKARHLANLEAHHAARAALEARWAAEDEARDALRAETLASFDRGLEAFHVATDGAFRDA